MLTGVVLLLLLLIVLLAIPVTLAYQISWPRTVPGYIRLQWAFGLVRMQLPLSQPAAATPEVDEVAQKIGHFERSSQNRGSPFAAMRQKPFRRRIVRFIDDVWCAVHKREVTLRVRIGLGDPADTGQLWAFMGPVSALLANIQEASFIIEPDFFESRFELDSSGYIQIIPLQMIYLTIGLLLSPPVWQGIKQMRKVG